MAGRIDARLTELGIELPDAPTPAANYVPYQPVDEVFPGRSRHGLILWCPGLKGGSLMAMGQQKDRQGDLMVSCSEMPRSPGHVFYDRLQLVLIEGGFDGFAEAVCHEALLRGVHLAALTSGFPVAAVHAGTGAGPCTRARLPHEVHRRCRCLGKVLHGGQRGAAQHRVTLVSRGLAGATPRPRSPRFGLPSFWTPARCPIRQCASQFEPWNTEIQWS